MNGRSHNTSKTVSSEKLVWLGMTACVMMLAAGCGPKKLAVDEGVIVKMKIVKGGQPLPVPDNANIPGMELVAPYQVTLVPTGSEGHQRGAYAGNYENDGSVTFTGPGKGIPPGTYKLTVVSSGAMPDAEGGTGDPLGGKFTLEKTPFEFTITVANIGKELDLGTIDLDKPKP